MKGVFAAALEIQEFLSHARAKFCFIGGVALQRWGQPRLTQDVDLTLLCGLGEEAAAIDWLLARFPARLPDARDFALRNRVLLLRTDSGVPIDVSLGAIPFEHRCVTRASEFDFGADFHLITFRPQFNPPWVGQSQVTSLTLARLSKRQANVWIERVTGQRHLPAEVLSQILAKTDGVPLFLEELTKTVLESGLLEESMDGYTLKSALPPLAIPSTLQDSLMARLDKLASVKDVAQIGACIGREFSYQLLEAVSALPQNRLQSALAELIKAELVFEHGSPPNATYMFKHALIKDAAYASLLRSRRELLHSSIATVLEERFPDVVANQPELVAHHFTEAGLIEKGLAHWEAAANIARERFANNEAVSHLNRAVENLHTLAESPTRDVREAGLWSLMGKVQLEEEGYGTPEQRRTFERLATICERAPDAAKIQGALFTLWWYNLLGAQYKVCTKILDQLEPTARSTSDEHLYSYLRLAVSRINTLFFTGNACRRTRPAVSQG